MIRSGLKRLVLILVGLFAATTLISIPAGLLSGTSLARALSLGFMLSGSFVFTVGAAIGLRGPARARHRSDGSLAGYEFASPEHRVESTNISYLLVAIGLFFVAFGVVIDPYVDLF